MSFASGRLSDAAVLQRWRILFAENMLVDRYLSDKQGKSALNQKKALVSPESAICNHACDVQSVDREDNFPTKPLLDLFDDQQSNPSKGIALSLEDYLELADWTGRAIINGKRGFISGLCINNKT